MTHVRQRPKYNISFAFSLTDDHRVVPFAFSLETNTPFPLKVEGRPTRLLL
jgi:hypothetical protein